MSDVIEAVSIISVGEAKGHGLYVDAQTLREVKACAETYAGGVKVNLDHGAGIKDIIGFVDNFRIVGEKLLGDLNLLQNADRRAYVLEIAEKLPDTFGISIAFSGPVRDIGGKSFASCEELYSADLVQTPAANPTGLFSFEARSVDKISKQMEDTPEIKIEPKEDEVSIADIVSRLSALESAFGDYKKAMEAAPEEPKEEAPKDSEMSKLEAKLDTIISNFGAAPMKASAPAEVPAEVKFDLKNLIEAKTAELGSKTAAIKFAMSNHPAEYIALRDSNQLHNL
jgi:cell pole-organizing protein PopZ